jgi:hypothetical protein
MRAASPTHALRLLIAALPEAQLRELVLEILLGNLPAGAATADPPGPKRRRGRPRGRPRGPRKAANRNGAATRRVASAASARRKRAEKRAAKQAVEQTAAEPESNSNVGVETVSAARFWSHAKSLNRERPWQAVMREFDVKEATARNCYDTQRLPPRVGPMAITRFLDLPVST